MQERANPGVAFSPMSVTAALSVVALVLFVGYEIAGRFAPITAVGPTPAAALSTSQGTGLDDLAGAIASSSDPISAQSAGALAEVVGAYAGLQSEGKYDPATASQIASSIGSSLSAPIEYSTYTSADITTDPDTSYKGMVRYRTALQGTLKPLMSNEHSEFELFADYVANGDQSDLDKLSAAAANYEKAASSTAALTVPEDAVQYQLGILNAMREFAATLRAMIAHAQDPLASAMLLSNYNRAQADMYTAFNALAIYEKSKVQ